MSQHDPNTFAALMGWIVVAAALGGLIYGALTQYVKELNKRSEHKAELIAERQKRNFLRRLNRMQKGE